MLVEKLGAGAWGPHLPDSTRTDGASAAAYSGDRLPIGLLAANLGGIGPNEEILLQIQDHLEIVNNPNGTDTYTGAWAAFWSIEKQGSSYRRIATYSPDPDLRSVYARTELVAAFACSPPEFAAGGIAVVGDFDGDGRDELVVFVAPVRGDSSRGNDFWALDRRQSGKLRPLGQIAGTLGTVGDLSVDTDVVADAFAADVDGDGRDELIALPYVTAAARGSTLWVADFQPGGTADPAEGGAWTQLAPIDLHLETTAVVFAVGADLDGDGADEIVLFGEGKTWVRKYDPVRGSWQALPDLSTVLPANSTVAAAAVGRFLPGGAEQVIVTLGSVAPGAVGAMAVLQPRRRLRHRFALPADPVGQGDPPAQHERTGARGAPGPLLALWRQAQLLRQLGRLGAR